MKREKEVQFRLIDRQRDRTKPSLTQLSVEVSQQEGRKANRGQKNRADERLKNRQTRKDRRILEPLSMSLFTMLSCPVSYHSVLMLLLPLFLFSLTLPSSLCPPLEYSMTSTICLSLEKTFKEVIDITPSLMFDIAE